MLWWIIGSIVGYLAVGSFMAGASDCKNCDDATLTVFLGPILLPFFGIAELGLKCRKATLSFIEGHKVARQLKEAQQMKRLQEHKKLLAELEKELGA